MQAEKAQIGVWMRSQICSNTDGHHGDVPPSDQQTEKIVRRVEANYLKPIIAYNL